jgi:hypothetical protein
MGSGARWGQMIGSGMLVVLALAIALLIAGYGVPVGLGALVGVILGFTAGLLSTMWLLRGTGRSVHWAGLSWASDTRPFDPGGEEMAEMQERAATFGVDLGAILAVTPILRTAEASGLVVELVSLERYEAGLLIAYDIRLRPGTTYPPSMASVSASDDLGSAYRAAAQSVSGRQGSVRHQVVVLPAPPAGAARLDLRIDSFRDYGPIGAQSVIGPWTFAIPLQAST